MSDDKMFAEHCTSTGRMLREAAAELRRLRDELAKYEALRRALRECVAKVGDYMGMGPLGGTPVQYLLAIRDVATAALAREQSKS